MHSHESKCCKAYSYARERYFAVLQAYVKTWTVWEQLYFLLQLLWAWQAS